MINITDVRIKKRFTTEPFKNILAITQITIDGCFVINDVKIIRTITNKMIISMPSRKIDTPEGKKFVDICHPLDRETREHIKEVILKAFYENKEE